MSCLRVLPLIAVFVSFCVFRTAYCEQQKKSVSDEKVLQVNVALKEKKPRWFVGDKIQLVASLKNNLDRDLFVPDWEVPRVKDEVWTYQSKVFDFPGYVAGPGWGSGRGSKVPILKFRKLEAGGTSASVSREFTLLLPGKMYVSARFKNRKVLCLKKINGEKKRVPYPGATKSNVFSGLTIEIDSEMSPEMSARYEKHLAIILDKTQAVETRLPILDKVAGEKHYFAVKFVRDIWTKADEGLLKGVALKHLVSLVEFGTAYEALPDLLEALEDESTSPPVRKQILDIFARMSLVDKQVSGLRIVGSGFYVLPNELHQRTLAVVKTIATGKDPQLAAKAKEILEDGQDKK